MDTEALKAQLEALVPDALWTVDQLRNGDLTAVAGWPERREYVALAVVPDATAAEIAEFCLKQERRPMGLHV